MDVFTGLAVMLASCILPVWILHGIVIWRRKKRNNNKSKYEQ